ncbi:MAG: hypothetical protein WC340_17005 [Kiritimatiellia bacterium]
MRLVKSVMFAIILCLLMVMPAFAVNYYGTDNYQEQGGERWVIGGDLDVASGGEIDIESGATFKVKGVTYIDANGNLVVNTDDFVVTITGDITMKPTGGDVSVTLGDAAGARTFTILDSAGVTVATINSDGVMSFVGATSTGALTVGADGVGHTVTFYGDTAGASLVWSDTGRKLVATGLNGQNAVEVPDGNVSITDDLRINTNKLVVAGATGDVTQQNSEDDATGVTITITKLRTTGGALQDNDVIYLLSSVGYNDNATPTAKTVANLKTLMTDSTDTTEDGAIVFETMVAGAAASEKLRVADVVSVTGDIKQNTYYQPTMAYATVALSAAAMNADGGNGVKAGGLTIPYGAKILRAFVEVTTGSGDAGDTITLILNDTDDEATPITTLAGGADTSAANLLVYTMTTGATLLPTTSAVNQYIVVLAKDVGDDAGATTALAGTLFVEYVRQ